MSSGNGRAGPTGTTGAVARVAEGLAKAASKYASSDITVIEDYKSAYAEISKFEHPSCITGSVYLVGAVKSIA